MNICVCLLWKILVKSLVHFDVCICDGSIEVIKSISCRLIVDHISLDVTILRVCCSFSLSVSSFQFALCRGVVVCVTYYYLKRIHTKNCPLLILAPALVGGCFEQWKHKTHTCIHSFNDINLSSIIFIKYVSRIIRFKKY